jgi:phage baseplate assembly protein V
VKLSDVATMLRPLQQRILNALARAVVAQVNDEGRVQLLQLQILKGEVRSDVERFQEYGLTSNPHPGAEALACFLGGNRDHGIVLVVDDRRYRLKSLAPGEVAVYDDLGSVVHLKRGGVIRVAAATKLEIDAPLVTMSGNLAVSGSVADNAGSMDQIRTIYDLHVHEEHDGPSTGPPLPEM